MYPNQQPQQPAPTPPPIDYLNQIAPQQPKKPLFTFGIKQLIVIGVILVVLVIVIASVANSIASSKRGPLEHLAARLAATQTIAENAQPNLKSSELRSLNSNLKLYLTNTNRDVAAPLLSADIKVNKLSKDVLKDESTAALAGRLEDARLNAVFDRTYAREMAYQLGTLMTLMNQIYNSTGNTQIKTFLQSAYSSLKPTQASFANFTAAS